MSNLPHAARVSNVETGREWFYSVDSHRNHNVTTLDRALIVTLESKKWQSISTTFEVHSHPMSLERETDTNALGASIIVNDLSYSFPGGQKGLSNISLSLPGGTRTLLIGANGAGKTTLLRLLSGKRLAPDGAISIAGVDPFKFGLEDVTYLGPEWVLNPTTRSDMDVPTLLRSVGGDFYKERRDELIRILDVDVSWRLHAISDGERRRVQLVMGLLRPWTVLLLDEITVDMDLLSRANFLDFLRRETEQRHCTIVYATHILDNLAAWPTHIVHMHLGTIKEVEPIQNLMSNPNGIASESGQLSRLVLRWLREDFADRGPRKGLTDP